MNENIIVLIIENDQGDYDAVNSLFSNPNNDSSTNDGSSPINGSVLGVEYIDEKYEEILSNIQSEQFHLVTDEHDYIDLFIVDISLIENDSIGLNFIKYLEEINYRNNDYEYIIISSETKLTHYNFISNKYGENYYYHNFVDKEYYGDSFVDKLHDLIENLYE